jgi:hypothetical protein
LWALTAALIVAWLHGCIGLTFWLRMKPLFQRAAPFLLAAAVLVPTLALLGIYQAGRSIAAESTDTEWRTNNLAQRQMGTPAEQKTLEDIVADSLIIYLGLVGIALLARCARAARRHDHAVLRQRPDHPRVEGPFRARGEPAQQRATCQRLRRPRPLLDLPHPRDRRPQ